MEEKAGKMEEISSEGEHESAERKIFRKDEHFHLICGLRRKPQSRKGRPSEIICRFHG